MTEASSRIAIVRWVLEAVREALTSGTVERYLKIAGAKA
jgi:hypothetical protein